MSHIRVKTIYNTEGSYGSVDKNILYADHNNSCDIVSFYDENGEIIMSIPDTLDNNLLEAIIRLYSPFNNDRELKKDVEFYSEIIKK